VANRLVRVAKGNGRLASGRDVDTGEEVERLRGHRDDRGYLPGRRSPGHDHHVTLAAGSPARVKLRAPEQPGLDLVVVRGARVTLRSLAGAVSVFASAVWAFAGAVWSLAGALLSFAGALLSLDGAGLRGPRGPIAHVTAHAR